MHIKKNILFIISIIFLLTLFGCNQRPSPQEVAQFMLDIKNCNFDAVEKTIKKRNETVFDFNKSISSNEIIFPPEINERNSKITFITKCKNQENELIVKNGVEVYELFIYSIIYDATLNDTRVRLRSEPNLSCETLGYLEKGDAVKIVDRTDEKFEIDGESWYWYKVEAENLPDGWVYGKYLDIEECVEED